MSTVDSPKAVVPITVGPSVLISSSVPETDHAAWAGGTYALASRVIKNHFIWESIQASNTGNDPETSPLWWKKVSATNQYKMFDDSNATQTVAPGSISFRLRPGRSTNAFAMLNMSGALVRHRIQDPVGGLVFDRYTLMRNPLTRSSPYAWCMTRRIPVNDYIAVDLPNYPAADTLIDVSVTSGNVAIGNVVIGQQVEMATGIELGARVRLKDYSTKETNSFGVSTLLVRDYGKEVSWQMPVPPELVDSLLALMASLRAKPTLYIGYQPIKALAVYGIWTECEAIVKYKKEWVMALDFLGLT